MICIMSNVIKVIVFTTDTDTFLTINNALVASHCTERINCAQK